LAVVLLAACSRKKNTFLSRNTHAVSAEYNALYNGGLAFEKGKEELALTYRDNFWEILPVERIEIVDEISLPEESKNPDFNRAEEKAAKAIQKHAIYIDGTEYNPQIDEAYMMLGKARYYDMRFIPALDAFNFILNKYPTSNNINRAKVWKAKTNIRLSSEDVAIESLQKMFDEATLEDEELADGAAIMAQAYINLDSIPEAVPYIKMASEYVKDNELKGRYAYIKGQLYNRLEQKDSANMAFDEVIALNRKSPRVYMINAHIAKAKNFNYEKEDRTALLLLLQDLEKNRENRPYLDRIYNQMGEYYRSTQNIDTAVIYYNKSIQTFREDKILQSVNYQTLAEINFDDAEYKIAGAYYDSTLTFLETNTRPWRRVKKKRENLDDVIKYEDIATTNDSILRFANMTEQQQLAYFTDYTARLKAKAVEDSIASVKMEKSIANKEFYKKNNEGGKDGNSGPSSFYFYNTATIAYGKQQFKSVWGDRSLEDNWRRSSKQTTGIEDEDEVIADAAPIAESELYKPETYIARIPTDQKEIDSIVKERNFAYYQLGLIYKEKFKEYGLAANRLEKLLTYNPEERLILPSKYNLHKIYSQLENTAMADKYKNDIITNHPSSRYAEILLNPNSQLATDESSPEFKYKALYKEFENSQYDYVINTCDEYINLYNGNDIVPKLEMLKATALGRRDGFEAYKKALNFVSLNYPNADEGKQAQNIYSSVLPKLAVKDFVADADSESWKIVYSFKSEDKEAALALKEKLDKAIEEYRYSNMSTSMDYYKPGTSLVIIHGLNTRLGGRGFGEILKENKKYKIKHPFFEISTPNYKIVQIHKNLEDYLNNSSVEEKNSNPQK
jgi:outer membrane protein assembly factor BamD (BamD/ComL family)